MRDPGSEVTLSRVAAAGVAPMSHSDGDGHSYSYSRGYGHGYLTARLLLRLVAVLASAGPRNSSE